MKAQSLRLISNPNMSFRRGESVFGVLLIFSGVNFRLKKKKKIVDCDCEFSCVYLGFHSDFICCVLRDLHADSLVRSFTQHLRRFLSFSSGCLQTRSWTGSITVFPTVSQHGFLLCFLDCNSRFKAGQ